MSLELIADQVFNDGLPDSISYDPQVTTIGDVSDIQTRNLLPIVDQLRVLCNIPNLPEPILDLLAFQYNVLFYAGTSSITDPVQRLAVKQQLIANNFNFHGRLGTPAVMQEVISAIYQEAIVQEWFAYGGTANHYRILFANVISGPTQTLIGSTQRAVKRASQAFDGFFVYNTAPVNFYVAVGVYTQIFQILPVAIPGRIGLLLTQGMRISANATVQSSSNRVTAVIGMTISATATQILAGAMHANLTIGMRMTNTARILRGISALIRIGHG